jgi:antirestriction protein ArdC
LLLFVNSLEFGYRSNRYITFKQAKSLGANVKKGEQGTPIFFFTMAESKEENEEGKKIKYPMMKSFTVFNIDQLEGKEFEFEELETFQNGRDEDIEKWVNDLDIDIKFEGYQPCYYPGPNFVRMTPIKYFKDSDNYYSTLFHELAHATGHESRLNRDMSNDKKAYGFEELIAELSSIFTCGEFGVNIEKCQHVEYLAGWIKVIREDKKILWKAASEAQKATDYLIGKK